MLMPHYQRFGLNGSGWEDDADMLKGCLGGANIQSNVCYSVFSTEMWSIELLNIALAQSILCALFPSFNCSPP